MLTLENNRALPLLGNNNLKLVLGVYADDLDSTLHQFTINCRDKVEIFYDGVISQDELHEPRRPQDTEEKKPQKTHPD